MSSEMRFARNITDYHVATQPNIQESDSALVESVLTKKSNYSLGYSQLSYSQCGDMFNSILFLSRSLNRMRIDHAIAGQSAIALTTVTASSPGTSIELVMSPQSYDHFVNVCIHQRIKPMPENDRMFWDHRTGCTLKIYMAGERIKSGRRTVTVPPLDTLLINDDGIKSWIIESKLVTSESRSCKVVASKRSKKKAVAAA